MKAYLEITPRRTAFSPKTFCFKSRTLAFPARPKPTTTIPEVLASVPDMFDWNLSFAGRAFTFWYNLSRRRFGQKISGELLRKFNDQFTQLSSGNCAFNGACVSYKLTAGIKLVLLAEFNMSNKRDNIADNTKNGCAADNRRVRSNWRIIPVETRAVQNLKM